MSEHVVVLVDGPNADNQACAWGAMNAFERDVNLAAVIVSATAVNEHPGARLGSRDIEQSRRAHRLHTARMAGLFRRRSEREVPVFQGLDIENTDITSPIPHSVHVRHEDYDIFGDSGEAGRAAIAGDFDDSLHFLDQLDGTIHLVGGGPFSEITHFLDRPRLVHKLGYLAVQAGMSLSERAIYSKLAFNVDVDMRAALKTFLHYPREIFMVPSDITRHPDVTFSSAQELIDTGIDPEIGEIFRQHRARAQARHTAEQTRRQAQGETLKPYPRLSIHDLQATLALSQVLCREPETLFEFAPINPQTAVTNLQRASELREPDFPPTITPELIQQLGGIATELATRYTVVRQYSQHYKQRVPMLLRARK